jgi:Ni,Fe-hydrogenase maturation factor
MTSDASVVNRVMQKLQLLLQEYQQLQKEQDRLLKQIRELEEENGLQKLKLDTMEVQLAALNSAKPSLSEEEKKQLERRLQQYIKEIERCIALLSE